MAEPAVAATPVPPPTAASAPATSAVDSGHFPSRVDVDPSSPAQPAPKAAVAPSSEPRHPFQEPVPPYSASAPATRLADLSPAECRRELRRRALPVVPHKTNTRGIAYALRLVGPLHGVTFITPPASSKFGLLDCRLALDLEELAVLLAEHGVKEVHVGNIYRRGARIAGRRRPSQHSYGLAMDVPSLRLRDGTLLMVERDFHGKLGDPACGPAATVHSPDERSLALRNIVCAIVRAGFFHHVLTPCGDYAHRNHLHFDIKRGTGYHRLR